MSDEQREVLAEYLWDLKDAYQLDAPRIGQQIALGIVLDPQRCVDVLVEAGVLEKVHNVSAAGGGEPWRWCYSPVIVDPAQPHEHEWIWNMDSVDCSCGRCFDPTRGFLNGQPYTGPVPEHLR